MSKKIGSVLLVLVFATVLIGTLLQGHNIRVLNPKGMIAGEQHVLIIVIIAILLGVVIPTLALLYFTAWKYRETNSKVTRNADTGHGKFLNVMMWSIPIICMTVLSVIMWDATHRLVPQKQITNGAKPITIQVVAMRWKWLFIYPEQKIATVNYVKLPAGAPVTFKLTADEAPMSAFWIPNLGGMIYAMTGHVNGLNLVADTPGEYPGTTAEINGTGFAGMKFTASVSSQKEFDAWASYTRLSSHVLDSTEYNKLLKPSESNPATYYAVANHDLYDTVVMKYMGHGMDHE